MANKIRVATTSLAGCFGCHMSFLDIDERMLQLVEVVEFDRSPITDIEHCTTAKSWLRLGPAQLTADCPPCAIIFRSKNV